MSKKKNSSRVPIRIKLLIGALIAVAIAGVWSVRFFETTAGQVVLVDAGLSSHHARVQEALEVPLHRALAGMGLDGGLTKSVRKRTIGRHRLHVREWRTDCPASRSLVEVNLSLTRAVREAGAAVQSSVEYEHGRMLVFEAGSRKYPTHRITIRVADSLPASAGPTPRLAIVIDDFGYSESDVAEAFLDMDIPLTIAVLPSLRHSMHAIERTLVEHKEPILHLPMEAEEVTSDIRPVLTSMSREEIATLIDGYLDESPGVIGVSNHLGSKATQDAHTMEAVMNVLKGHGLYFLDSLTSSKSIAYTTARALGVPAARNSIFLDDDTEDPTVVEERLYELVALARRHGSAIGIGHPHPWTFEAIRANEGMLRRSGVGLALVSELVE